MYYEVGGLLDRYAFRNDMPAKTLYGLKALFEELCHELLLPVLDDKKISFTAEYDAEKAETVAVVSYPGKSYNPMESDNAISSAIVRNLASEIIHSFQSDSEYSNRLSITLKSN